MSFLIDKRKIPFVRMKSVSICSCNLPAQIVYIQFRYISKTSRVIKLSKKTQLIRQTEYFINLNEVNKIKKKEIKEKYPKSCFKHLLKNERSVLKYARKLTKY